MQEYNHIKIRRRIEMSDNVRLIYIKEPYNCWLEVKEDKGETLIVIDEENNIINIKKEQITDEAYV